jgi:hypothetical protein
LNCTQNRPAVHTNLDEYFENKHLESGSQVLPTDELMANEYLWSQVTMGEYLVEIVQYFHSHTHARPRLVTSLPTVF